ncbi:MAG: hypothetical protein ACP5JJ_17925 [Anaerolineae bacterium]
MKINKPLLIVGIALALVAVLGLLFAGRLLNPPPLVVPVALQDIPRGTALDYGQFRLEEWAGLNPQTTRALFLADEFPAGAAVIVDVPAGSPLYRAYVDTEAAPDYVTRLTHLVRDTDLVLMALPVAPDTGGNLPQPGDEVDLVVSIGQLRADVVHSHPTPTPPLTGFGGVPTTVTQTLAARETATETLELPLSALVLQNVPVLQVAREQITTGGAYGSEGEPKVVEGDTQQLYVGVTRAQAETLAFLLHNGEVLLAVHPPGRGASYPGGLTWTDFETQFFAQRPAEDAAP